MAKEIVSGIHKTGIGNWDGMHKFASQGSGWAGLHGWTQFGANSGSGKVGQALVNFYKTYNLNPCITSVKLTVDPVKFTVAYEFTIEESPDGNAYVGFSSWGGASGGYPKKKPPGSWAYSNYKKEYDGAKKNHAGTTIKDVIDFYFPGGFRQIFFQYTHPSKYKNLPKSAEARKGTVGVKIGPAGSPTGLPEYNGILVSTVTYEDEPKEDQATQTDQTQTDQTGGTDSNTNTDSQTTTQEVEKKKDTDPRNTMGRVTLKVKSGPGVIIGITEVDILEGKADFSEIEFDQAGDYVISVTSTSPDVDPTEINIKVLPQPEVIPQDAKGGTESNTSGTRPIIAQIDKPLISLKSMDFDRQGTDIESTKQVASTIGLTPFLNYNGSQINDRDIQSFTLEHEGMIPKVNIIFADTNGMISKEPPRDDTKFEIFLQSRSPNLKSIHLKFKIEDFVKLPSKQYSLSGTLDVSDLYRNKFKVKRGTSFEVLREICKDLKLGFNSNIENTKDNMPWRNIGDKQYKFMEEIIKHSYISDTSFMAGYIDFYYCFNYVDIEKEMKRDISKDVGIDTGGIDDPSQKDSNKIGKLVLSSEKGLQSSNNYFVKLAERNESTKISMEQGYKTRTKFYDKVKKMFLVFDVDSTTTDGAKSIILKAGENDKESFENNYVTKYQGKIDTDNTHVNYNYAVTQNKINLDNMMKNQLDIVLPNPNFNLYRFQKIMVFLVKEAATVAAPETIEWRYSGEWLIASIKFNFANGTLTQNITLARKEMGKNPEEIKKGTNNATQEKKEEKNENPIVGTASETITDKPNQRYKVGDIFTVQNSDGTKYVLTVTKLSENGNDIVATLKDPAVVPNKAITSTDSTPGVTQSSPGVTQSSPVTGTASQTTKNTSGIYTGDVKFGQYPFSNGDFSQQDITKITKNYSWVSQNGNWVGTNFVSSGTGTTISEIENLKDMKSIFIAIKRPVPTYKPVDLQKSMTPFNWVLFELSDSGIDDNDMSGKNAGTLSPEIYQGLMYRLFYAMEAWGHTNGGGITWGGFDDGGNVPHGSIKIYDESKKVVLESSFKGTGQPNPGTVDTKWKTGENLIRGGFTGTPPKYNYDAWFTSSGELVPSDQAYTNVGGNNTIYYDMSDPEKYKPGVYTIEIKYYVPIYEKVNADGENVGKPYNGTGGWYVKKERLTIKETEKPYEEKTLTATFTIVKKPKKI